jgi:predicted esterase
MESRHLLLLCLLIALCGYSCSKEESVDPGMGINTGENYFTTNIDGDTREYLVHVPTGYDGSKALPVVFMLHGGSGTGSMTYNSSGWKELGEEENFISVFPTAWTHCWIKKNGAMRDTTRWNSLPGIFEFCPGERPRDDIKFIRTMIDELQQMFLIDDKRIYMVGFSSGAQMTFRCAVELSDLLAAVVQSGATHQVGTDLEPEINLPVAFEVGNEDATWFENGIYPPLAFFDTLLTTWGPFQKIISVHATTFDFETSYEISGNEPISMTATFAGFPDAYRTFKFSMIANLDHSYPNGHNVEFYGARHHWDWMKKYSSE